MGCSRPRPAEWRPDMSQAVTDRGILGRGGLRAARLPPPIPSFWLLLHMRHGTPRYSSSGPRCQTWWPISRIATAIRRPKLSRFLVRKPGSSRMQAVRPPWSSSCLFGLGMGDIAISASASVENRIVMPKQSVSTIVECSACSANAGDCLPGRQTRSTSSAPCRSRATEARYPVGLARVIHRNAISCSSMEKDRVSVRDVAGNIANGLSTSDFPGTQLTAMLLHYATLGRGQS
jgi:hypothetical protein